MFEQISASPNPFTNIVQVKINNTQDDYLHFIIRLIDEKGNICRMIGISLVDGTNKILIDRLHKLSAGYYYLDVKNIDGKSVFETKLLKR